MVLSYADIIYVLEDICKLGDKDTMTITKVKWNGCLKYMYITGDTHINAYVHVCHSVVINSSTKH